MKVFVSSVVAGMEACRDAVERAAESLDHTALRSEQIGARPDSPQRACLDLVRQADVVVLLLGARYGTPQASGYSPTHEEFHEARDRCRVLCFVQSGVTPEAPQVEFIREVRGWADGLYTAEFRDAEELRDRVVSALHRLELSEATAPVDSDEMLARARSFFSVDRGSPARLAVAVAFGPKQAVRRPSELDDGNLMAFARRAALTGDHAVLSTGEGTQDSLESGRIVLRQASAEVVIDELGSVATVAPIWRKSQRDHRLMLAIIQEDLVAQIENALAFANEAVEFLDQRHRLSHFAPVVRLMGAEYFGWQTRAQHDQSSNSAAVRLGGGIRPVSLVPPHRPRAALRFDARRVAEDLVALLKRAWP